jgi:hypothetical protein
MPHDLREPIHPDVPDVIRAQATPVEIYILERMSIGEQQRDRIVLCLESLHAANADIAERLETVEELQGRHDLDLGKINARWKTIISVFIFIGPVVLIVLERIAQRIWP